VVEPYFGENEHDTKKITCLGHCKIISVNLSTGALAKKIYFAGIFGEGR
jgi:hypothetical protein